MKQRVRFAEAMEFVVAAFVVCLIAIDPLFASTQEEAFLRENTIAMNRMMKNMDPKAAGDIDVDFVDMMEPHHQGAIDMAMLELRYGKNEQLRRIAQEIIVDQQQEITAMRLALGRELPRAAPAPDQPHDTKPVDGMSMRDR